MKVTAISDTHLLHKDIKIEECDLLITAGDFTLRGKPMEISDFIHWFAEQPAKRKLLVPGNHDFDIQRNFSEWKGITRDLKIDLVDNDIIYIEGYKIFCSAWTPYFYDWAYNGTDDLEEENKYAGPNLKRLWRPLENEAFDLVVTHGPPRGILDKNREGDTCGSKVLRHLLDNNDNIKNMIWGHIHEAHGYMRYKNTNCYNVAMLNRTHELVNSPTVFEL